MAHSSITPAGNRLDFAKMHGLGNDFVILDGRHRDIPMDSRLARFVADRKMGIGCDQLILLEPSDLADLRMRIFNADGSEVESCGNASRCVVKLIGHSCTIETAGGLLQGRPEHGGFSVEMTEPRFSWDDIPLAYAMDAGSLPLAWDELQHGMAVNMGNPHIVFFVDDLNAVEIETLGPRIEQDPVFPDRVNVNIAEITSKGIRLRTWERGSGLTLACGSGACATAVAAIKRKLAASCVRVMMKGGDLIIDWPGEGPVTMTGDAVHVFSGSLDMSALT